MQAAELFAQQVKPPEAARRLRLSVKSAGLRVERGRARGRTSQVRCVAVDVEVTFRCTSVRGAPLVNSGVPAPSTTGARCRPSTSAVCRVRERLSVGGPLVRGVTSPRLFHPCVDQAVVSSRPLPHGAIEPGSLACGSAGQRCQLSKVAGGLAFLDELAIGSP